MQTQEGHFEPKIEQPNDVEIPFLGIYPEKMKTLIWKDTCTPMFITKLSTVAKTCRQHMCPSSNDWFMKWKDVSETTQRENHRKGAFRKTSGT